MRCYGKILYVGVLMLVSACTFRQERTYFLEEPTPEEVSEYSAIPCAQNEKGGFLDSRLWSQKEVSEICTLRKNPSMTKNSLRYCESKRRCSEEAMLPPQPCLQPMPTYYSDISATQTQEGILLQHPVTRTQVLCFDLPNQDAVACAENFIAAGYVLITDIPQVSANYDEVRTNTYPTRRWRNGGEYVPRW